MHRILILAALTIFGLLPGCGVKTVGVCSKSGGQCCALAFSNDANGNPNYTWYQCVADGVCPPQGSNGSPKFPETSPPNGYCDAEYKTVWAWESDYWSSLAVPVLAKNSRIPLADIRSETGQPIDPASPAFCRAACESGSSEFCQFAIVPNDVSVGLLSLISRIAASGNVGSRVIPITDVVRDFNVNAGLDACPRSDVIVDNGKVLNSGKACNSSIGPKQEGAAFESDLATPMNIIADVVSTPGYATYASQANAFSLNFKDAGLQSSYGGWLSVTTPSRSIDVVATVHRLSSPAPCASIAPEVSARLNFHQLVNAASEDQSIIARAINDLKRFIAKVDDKRTTGNQGKFGAMYPSLGPLTDEYTSLLDALTEADKVALRGLRYAVTSKTMTVAVTPVQVLSLIDAEICHSIVTSDPDASPSKFYPEIKLGEPTDRELMSFRNLQAGRYLLCKFGYDRFPPSLRQALAKAADGLGRPK